MPLETGHTYNMMVIGIKHYKDIPMRGGAMHRLFDIVLRDVNEMTFNCSYPCREMENTHFVVGKTACFVVTQQLKTTIEIDPCQFTGATKLSAEPSVNKQAEPSVMSPFAPPPGKEMIPMLPQDPDTAALYMATMIVCAQIHAGQDVMPEGVDDLYNVFVYADSFRQKMQKMKDSSHSHPF